ncbi:hypothetical protein [Mesorhizobium sp.]|uniref:hypothetical protein n=1 Tax=Mesorhizobium sp. TaxID=1871066 RepID=UPI000FEAB201|nr:hypothetical protein [Mesorhizobium sp.]RWQ24222.1 MAG: hypothetical protein EOR93_04715 [Mesorhizobium sp.]
MRATTVSVVLAVLLVFLLLWIGVKGQAIVVGGAMDVATLALTAATLVVTGVGVVAALLAIFGFQLIKEAAILAATEAAQKEATAIATVVATRVAREVPPSDTSDQEAADIVSSLNNGDTP